ncbi:MAG: RDD family protein [Aureispira sp.]
MQQELLDDWMEEEEAMVYEPASLGIRFIAFVIDLFIFMLLIMASSISTIIFDSEAWFGLVFLGGGIAIVMHQKEKNASYGKQWMGLQIVHIEEPRLHWANKIVRFILKYIFISSPILFAIVTFIAKRQRKDPQQVFLHDVASRTKVVKRVE